MLPYLGRRLLQVIPTLLGVTIVVFLLIRVSGDPTQLLLPETAAPADRELFKKQHGLDRPIAVQYARYVGDLFRGDFGRSLIDERSALDAVLERLPATIELTVAAMLLAVLVGIPIGILAAVRREGLGELVVLDEPIADVYGAHWSTRGADVPGAETADEAVYLPGRNLLLTVKAAVWCRLRGIRTVALGCLGSNPFPDSTPDFFEKLECLLNQAMSGGLRLIRPFDHLRKADVLARGRHLPLHLTFSCINPVDGLHCGACNKCAERKNGLCRKLCEMPLMFQEMLIE